MKIRNKQITFCAAALIAVALLVTGCQGSKTGSTGYDNPAKVQGSSQTVTTKFGPNDYAPLTVQKGIPVKWTIQMDQQDLNNCNNAIAIPSLGIEKTLQAGETVVEFTPKESGTITYSCWMGMIHNSITVVDDLEAQASTGTSPNTAAAATPAENTAAQSTNEAPVVEVATMDGGKATANLRVTSNGYEPAVIIVQKGVETTFKFDVKDQSCALYVVFPQLAGEYQDLTQKDTVTITPTEDFDIKCSMEMYGMKVRVVENLNGSEVDAIKKAVQDDPAANTFQNSGGCACCG